MLDQRKMCVLCKCRCVWLASAKEGVWLNHTADVSQLS